MNRSDVSENDLKHEDEDEFDARYNAPKAVPISEILAKDADDQALNKYKQHLIGDAINVIIGEISQQKKLQNFNCKKDYKLLFLFVLTLKRTQ
jgi:hypothetical protein